MWQITAWPPGYLLRKPAISAAPRGSGSPPAGANRGPTRHTAKRACEAHQAEALHGACAGTCAPSVPRSSGNGPGPMREELGWLGRELGAVRDADVLLARLATQARALPEESGRSHGSDRRALSSVACKRTQRCSSRLAAIATSRCWTSRSTQHAQSRYRKAKPIAPLSKHCPHSCGGAGSCSTRGQIAPRPARGRGPAHGPASREALPLRCRDLRAGSRQANPQAGRRRQSPPGDARRLNDAVVAEHWLRDWASHARSIRGAFAGRRASRPRTRCRRPGRARDHRRRVEARRDCRPRLNHVVTRGATERTAVRSMLSVSRHSCHLGAEVRSIAVSSNSAIWAGDCWKTVRRIADPATG